MFDPVQGDVSFDGVTGARTNSFPSVDIANGAPTGADATNVLSITWADAGEGLNKERALVSLSGDGGNTWTAPVDTAASGDRPDFPAVALAPDGSEIYEVYDGFLQPFQTDNSQPRLFQGVVRAAPLSGTTAGAFVTLGRGEAGDARASSANALEAEFLGDYNYVEATRTGAVAVYNDARSGAAAPLRTRSATRRALRPRSRRPRRRRNAPRPSGTPTSTEACSRPRHTRARVEALRRAPAASR